MRVLHRLGELAANRLGMYVERRKKYLKYLSLILKALRTSRRLGGRCAVLDLGCGDGYFANKLSCFCTYTLAIDIRLSPSWRSRQSADVEYIVADARSLPLQANSIDFVYALSLLEHVQSWNLVIREVARVLRKGGLLVIQIPNLRYLVEPHTKFPLLGFLPETLRRAVMASTGSSDLQFDCTLKNVIKELEKSGFIVLGIFPHYHSRALGVLLVAPSYFIVAMKKGHP